MPGSLAPFAVVAVRAAADAAWNYSPGWIRGRQQVSLRLGGEELPDFGTGHGSDVALTGIEEVSTSSAAVQFWAPENGDPPGDLHYEAQLAIPFRHDMSLDLALGHEGAGVIGKRENVPGAPCTNPTDRGVSHV